MRVDAMGAVGVEQPRVDGHNCRPSRKQWTSALPNPQDIWSQSQERKVI